jgi:hypothetical protein
MSYISRSRNRCNAVQIIGLVVFLFFVFIRYTSFCNFDQVTNIDQGRWPTPLNALFNGVAPYFFLTSIILIFLPVFLSKLCLARDIFACDFFRPLSRLNFSVANVQGLALFMIIFSSR